MTKKPDRKPPPLVLKVMRAVQTSDDYGPFIFSIIYGYAGLLQSTAYGLGPEP